MTSNVKTESFLVSNELNTERAVMVESTTLGISGLRCAIKSSEHMSIKLSLSAFAVCLFSEGFNCVVEELRVQNMETSTKLDIII